MKYTKYAAMTGLAMLGMGVVFADDLPSEISADDLPPSEISANTNKPVNTVKPVNTIKKVGAVKTADVGKTASNDKPVDTAQAKKNQDCAFGHMTCHAAPHRRSNFWVSGDLLIWNVCEDGFTCQFGTTTVSNIIVDSIPTLAIDEKDEDIDFDWGLGVRLGMGIDWPCSGWDIAGYWTHFNGKGGGEDGRNHADWWLHYNVADAVLERKFWVGRCVSLKPSFGLRYAQIKQGLRTRLVSNLIFSTGTGIARSRINDKEKFWGLGPELGVEANFYLGHRWSLYGNLGGAMLYGHTKTIYNDEDLLRLGNAICEATSTSCANQLVLDFGLGIRWEFRHLTLQAGLEDHDYFAFNHIGCCGNLNLYGANVSATIHF